MVININGEKISCDNPLNTVTEMTSKEIELFTEHCISWNAPLEKLRILKNSTLEDLNNYIHSVPNGFKHEIHNVMDLISIIGGVQ